MELTTSSDYLPRNKLDRIYLGTKKRMSSRAYKKMLKKHGRFDRQSHFKILDVGSGAGYNFQSWEKTFPNASIFSGDNEKSLIAFTQKNFLNNQDLIQFDAQRLPFKSKQFDVVISIQVIEHLAEPVDFLAECTRVLRMGGFLIISTPNPTGIAATVLKNKWQGYKKDHISLKSPQQWRQIIRTLGFHLLEDGSTGLGGFKILQKLPFALINWIPMIIFGYFPWYKGESYMVIARKV